jgi:hypothetical protein
VIALLSDCLVCRGDERFESDPSPIDAMVGDEPAGDVHHFNQVDLIALGRCARIFPGQLPAIGEECSRPIPAAEFVPKFAEPGGEEGPDFGFAL